MSSSTPARHVAARVDGRPAFTHTTIDFVCMREEIYKENEERRGAEEGGEKMGEEKNPRHVASRISGHRTFRHGNPKRGLLAIDGER